MSNIAIKVENLGKRYIIHHEKKESYKTFQDVLVNGGKKVITSLNPFAKTSTLEDETREEFWALDDVNFDSGIVKTIEWYLEKYDDQCH